MLKAKLFVAGVLAATLFCTAVSRANSYTVSIATTNGGEPADATANLTFGDGTITLVLTNRGDMTTNRDRAADVGASDGHGLDIVFARLRHGRL